MIMPSPPSPGEQYDISSIEIPAWCQNKGHAASRIWGEYATHVRHSKKEGQGTYTYSNGGLYTLEAGSPTCSTASVG